MRRRMKKMRQQKGIGPLGMKIKKKYKYETRSRHARNRKRAKDGKFLSAPDNQENKTVSTVLKAQDEGEEEEREPCMADEPEEPQPKRKHEAEKEEKIKLEMENMDNISMNSEELLGAFRSGTRRTSRREPIDHNAFEEAPTLRHHDSLFEGKR
jgi:hypothetical protein